MIHVRENENGGTIEMTAGDTLEVRLPANPTTGSHWRIQSEGAPACVAVDSHFETGGGPPGRGGTHHWRFRAAGAGEGRIELIYGRDWEKAAQTFTLHVHVKPDRPPAAFPG